MYIGHINLERSMNGTGEHFVKLVEGLNRQGVRQHILVSNASLSKRVAIYENVIAGPVVKTAVMAYCLMPDVDVVHVHDAKSNQAGLVLRLTRSLPYVVTRRSLEPVGANPLSRSLLARASGVICPSEEGAELIREARIDVPLDVVEDNSFENGDAQSENRIAEHHRIYRRAVDTRRIPALLL